MARVYAIWFLKKMTSRFALELFSFVILSTYLAYHVSLGHIASNFYLSAHSFGSAADFILSAFTSTEAVILATFVGLAAASFFLIKDLIKVTFRLTRAF